MDVRIEMAKHDETDAVLSILDEAAKWLDAKGATLWTAHQLNREEIAVQIENGMYWLAKVDGEIAGCFRYQNEDMNYWDDVPHADSAFVHKVAVKREFAGGEVSRSMLDFAKQKATSEGKKFLRLDCAKREKLCRFYESHGFVFHSEKIREPYLVVRYEFSLRSAGSLPA
jgi:predicted GNAT family N-acyltransferase